MERLIMKEWITENILKSRTAWAACIALIIGITTWICAVPKDLGGWVALGTFIVTALGGWVAANKVQANINTKIEDGK
jgi:hypothetical protein